MDATRRTHLIRQRPVTRMQIFIESGDRKVHENHVSFDDLKGIFDRYDTAQIELELFDDTSFW